MVARIELACGSVVVVDDLDVALVAESKWRYRHANRGKSYVVRGAHKYGKLYREGALHRLIAGAADGEHVDHRNGDTLDNRRSNLRIVTHQQNCQNAAKKNPAVSASRFKGVSLDKRRNTWRAMISVNGKPKYLGEGESEIEAAYRYDMASLANYGEFGLRNFLPLCHEVRA